MSIIDGLLIFVSILFFYFLIALALHKIGFLEKHNISLAGPALLIRTKKGLKFLKKIAGKGRYWKSFGSFGIVFCFIVMIIMIVFFIWQTWMLYLYPRSRPCRWSNCRTRGECTSYSSSGGGS